jgi:hypothetical protein
MDIGPSEAETFWTAFLRKVARRGLRDVKLVISDAHEGIKAAIAKVLHATWQRCRVHFIRNALAHAGRQGRHVVSAFIATAFAQDDAEAARAQWRRVADQLRPKLPKLAAFLDEAETDVLAYMSFPAQHRAKLHSTNPLERVNGEIKRRTEVVAGPSLEIRCEEGLRLEFAFGIADEEPADRHRCHTAAIPERGAAGDFNEAIGSTIPETDAVSLPGDFAILEDGGELFWGLPFRGGRPRPLGLCGGKSNRLASRRNRVTTQTWLRTAARNSMAANRAVGDQNDIAIGEPAVDLQGGLTGPIEQRLGGSRLAVIEAFGGGEQREEGQRHDAVGPWHLDE